MSVTGTTVTSAFLEQAILKLTNESTPGRRLMPVTGTAVTSDFLNQAI